MSEEQPVKKVPVEVVVTNIKIPMDSIAALVLKLAAILFLFLIVCGGLSIVLFILLRFAL